MIFAFYVNKKCFIKFLCCFIPTKQLRHRFRNRFLCSSDIDEKKEQSVYILNSNGIVINQKGETKHFPISLSDNERRFLIDNIRDSKKHLEFGSGGSTLLALTNTQIPYIISVESDNNWIKYLETFDTFSMFKKNRLHFLYVDIGPTGMWGVPTDEVNNKHKYPLFSTKPFEISKNYDSVFIDGRFRVACTIQTVLNCSKKTKILIHDFCNRPEYHVVLQFLDIIDVADMLALLKIKDNINRSLLLELFDKYKFNPD